MANEANGADGNRPGPIGHERAAPRTEEHTAPASIERDVEAKGAGPGAERLWHIIIPRTLGAADVVASANAATGSAQFYLTIFFTAVIWLGSWLQ